MPHTVSYNSFDLENVIFVPVIVTFDTSGHIRPLYVRLDGSSCKVESCWLKPGFARRYDFMCKIACHDTLVPIVLSYHVDEQVWTIPQP